MSASPVTPAASKQANGGIVMRVILAVVALAVLALAACSSGNYSSPAASVTAPHARHTVTVSPGASARPSPAPTVTQTVTPPPPPPASPGPSGVQASTPWAVVSEYYGDIQSGDYAGAYALLSSGNVTGQTYQQFVTGFACTSYQDLSDLGTSGDTVTISLTAINSCSNTTQQYQGTYTVQNGLITAANITQTG
jgi:hypothetical protein